MQVLEHEDERHLRPEGLDELGHLAEHPVTGGAEDEHGHVRFRGPELLEALAAGDGEGVGACGTDGEVLDEGCLPRARLAGHEHDLPLAAERTHEPLLEELELASTAHEDAARLAPRPVARRPGEDRAPHPEAVAVGGDALGVRRFDDGGNEPIAAAIHGLDEPGLRRRIAERRPDLGHADLEHPVGDMRVRPDCVEEIVLRHELAAAVDQHPEHVECFRVQAERPSLVLEADVAGVESKTIETENDRSRQLQRL